MSNSATIRLITELKQIVRQKLDYLDKNDDDEATRSRMHDLMMLTAYLCRNNIDEALEADENIQLAIDLDY